MTLSERGRLVLAFARVLYVNGQSTDQVLTASARLGDALQLRLTIIPRWGELELQSEDGDHSLVSVVDGNPVGVDMDRVASTMRAVDEVEAGRLAPCAAMLRVGDVAKNPPAPTWMFALAAAVGAVALAVLF